MDGWQSALADAMGLNLMGSWVSSRLLLPRAGERV